MIVFSLLLLVLMLVVMYLDITRYIIPNWLVGLVLLLYPFYYWLCPVPIDIKTSLLAMLAAFLIGYMIFAAKIMGGGDIKLLTALCLWTGGTKTLVAFLMYTGLLGGALSLLLIMGRPVATWYMARDPERRTLPKVVLPGSPVPYGIAIAGAFIILIINGKIPGLPAIL
jgi:prepilin peptidase CpaA